MFNGLADRKDSLDKDPNGPFRTVNSPHDRKSQSLFPVSLLEFHSMYRNAEGLGPHARNQGGFLSISSLHWALDVRGDGSAHDSHATVVVAFVHGGGGGRHAVTTSPMVLKPWKRKKKPLEVRSKTSGVIFTNVSTRS